LDRHVGTLLQVIERTLGLENTLIIYGSDHGEMMGEQGLFWKSNLYEGSARVPLVFYRKGMIDGGRTITSPTSLLDLATTILAHCGGRALPGAGRPLPPVPNCERIGGSREERNQALSRAMNDVDKWSAITVVGAHESGHCHVHTGVWTNEPVGADRFEPVVQAHIRNSPVAEPEGHGTGAITLRSDSASLTAELGKNAPGLDTRGDRSHGVLSDPAHKQFGATVLDAGGWRAVRF
jgi:hypothetical protein